MPLPPVLLLHGFASSSESWTQNGWTDLLREDGREVIAPDLLGHGHAPKPRDPAAYSAIESHVWQACGPAPLLDAVGFSYGSRLLLSLAAAEPARFRRLVVGGVGENVFTPGDPEPLAAAIEGSAARTPVLDPMRRMFVIAARKAPNDAVALAAFLRGSPPGLTPETLARVTCPVLVVAGTEDDRVHPLEPLLAALPEARLVLIRGADHMRTMKSFEFLDAALRFLSAPDTPL